MDYLFAATVAAVAVLMRALLDPVLGDSLPLVTLFGAVAAAVMVAGMGPALLATVGGYLACSLLFIAPRGQFALKTAHAVGLGAYLFTCGLIIAAGEAARRSRLRASDRTEILRVTLASIGDAVITTDTRGHITYLNAVAERLTGWSNTDAARVPLERVFRIINEGTRQPVENPAVKALREGTVVGLANHTILIRKDGTEIAIDDSAAPIKNDEGMVSGCVLIFRDVTERRRFERESVERLTQANLLAAIVESSDDAIVRKAMDGTIQSWNAGAERLFGYSAQEAIGKHISLVIPPDRLSEEDRIIGALSAGRQVDHFETERVRRNGERVIVSLTISPVRDADGRIVAASKIARDVTERRRLEDEVRRLMSELRPDGIVCSNDFTAAQLMRTLERLSVRPRMWVVRAV